MGKPEKARERAQRQRLCTVHGFSRSSAPPSPAPCPEATQDAHNKSQPIPAALGTFRLKGKRAGSAPLPPAEGCSPQRCRQGAP